jgi:hypothetical protein
VVTAGEVLVTMPYLRRLLVPPDCVQPLKLSAPEDLEVSAFQPTSPLKPVAAAAAGAEGKEAAAVASKDKVAA